MANDPDYDQLLRANLQGVFNERDASQRMAAISALFVAEPVLYEPAAIVRGRARISEAAAKVLAQFPPSFRFVPLGVAAGHHGVGCLRWQAGPQGGDVVITGSDVAMIEDGKIAQLWVLLDPRSPAPFRA